MVICLCPLSSMLNEWADIYNHVLNCVQLHHHIHHAGLPDFSHETLQTWGMRLCMKYVYICTVYMYVEKVLDEVLHYM